MDAMDPPGMERGVPSRRGSQGQSIDSVFSTLFPPPKVEKVPPASSAGLSRPRLLKVRRHFPSLRERPSVAVPAGFKDINEQRLNPFQRSAYPAASCSSQVSTSSSEPSTLMFGNSSNSSAAFANVDSCPSSVDHNAGGLKPGTRADCFRYGSSLEQCIAPDLRTPLAFGNTAAGKLPEEFQRLNMKHSWNEKYSQNVSGSFISAQNVSGLFGERNHPPGSFSIRSSSRERKISAEKLPHHLRGLDINDPALENMHGDANSKFSTAGIQNPIGKANPSTGVFDFQATKTHSYDKEDADSVLPLDIRKLKIEVPGGDSGISKREGSYSSSQGDGIKKFSFIFGSNKWIAPHEEIETVNSQQNTSDQPERVKNEDTFKCTSGFAFRTPSDQGIGPDRVDDNGFDESTELPKKIQNLNIKDTVSRDGPSIASDRNFVFSSSKNFSGSYSGENITEAFNFGNESSVYKPSKGIPPIASQNKTADQSGHNKDGVSCNSATGFAFISPSEKIIVPDQGADDGLDEDAAGKLPEEIQKLRIKNPENEEKVRLDGGIPKTGGAGFVFTSSTTVSGLSTEENPDGLFFFGGKTTSSARYVSGSYGGTFFEEPVISSSGMGPGTSCSAGAVEDSNNSSKTKDSDYVSASSSFTSEGRKYFSAQSGDSYSSAGVFVFGSSTKGSKVNDQYGSFLSDRHDKPLDKLSEPDFPFGKAAVYESESSVDEGGVSVCSSGTNKTLLEQSSQSCNPNANSVKPTIDEKAPSFSILFDPVFQSSGHGSTFTGYGECGMPQENKSKREDPAKKGVSRHARARKRRGKLKETTMLFQGNSTGKSLREKSSQDKPDLDSQGGYSPMDFSPCHVEGPVGEVYSREASVASEESMTIEPSHLLNKINSSFSANGSTEDLGNVAMKSSNSVELLKEAYGGCGFPMDSCSNDLDGSGFTFGASSSARSSLLSSKHNQRRKFKAKVGQNGFVPASDPSTLLFPNLSGSSLLDGKKTQTEGPSARHRHESERKTMSHLKEGISPSPSQESERKTTTAQQACEKWRLRGNQAYADGDLYKAEEYYTRGVKSVSPDDTSLGCRRTLMLCYSNRAATLMSVGRIRDALSDCMMATDIDPGFFRAQLRAASCHLLLGETEEACNRFKKCLHGGCGSSLDEKFVFEASDGLHKVKLVADCMERASSLLQKGTAENAATVLQIIPDALSLSPYSESLIEMKAEALLMLHHYGELILLLDQTLDSAEKNSSRSVLSHAKAWRAYLKSRAYFCLGKLDEALAMIKDNRDKSDSFALLSATVSELLRLKVAGNTAFKSGKHSEAVEHYTAALTYNIESRPFTAVCFCNRAAAYQAMGQLTEAISDCSLAIALDPDYPKAISRIATLHEMIRDYSQAGKDLCRLISLLERKQEYEIGGGRPANHVNDIELARSRLAKVEEKAKKEIPLDMYRILGVEASSDVAEIKKAYRKAALRHHPDKASQLLVRSESTDEKLRKEVADEVHRDADRLFKMIGEAYAVLSDPSKRRQYDAEEEIRKTLKGSSNVSGSSSTHHRYYYYKNDTGHYERGGDAWHMPFESSGRRSSGTYRTRRYY